MNDTYDNLLGGIKGISSFVSGYDFANSISPALKSLTGYQDRLIQISSAFTPIIKQQLWHNNYLANIESFTHNMQLLGGIADEIANMMRPIEIPEVIKGDFLHKLDINIPDWSALSWNAGQYDYSQYFQAFQSYVEEHDFEEDDELDDIIEEFTEEYISDELKETQSSTYDEDKIKERKRDVRDIIQMWVAIISLLLGVYSVVSTKPTTVNNTTVVNNYYVGEMQIDKDVLNAMSYRIVNENNVRPRLKPDNSSRVMGDLSIGQVVIVCEKYKKWIKVSWEDEEGNTYYGWIQHYKVMKFK